MNREQKINFLGRLYKEFLKISSSINESTLFNSMIIGAVGISGLEKVKKIVWNKRVRL